MGDNAPWLGIGFYLSDLLYRLFHPSLLTFALLFLTRLYVSPQPAVAQCKLLREGIAGYLMTLSNVISSNVIFMCSLRNPRWVASPVVLNDCFSVGLQVCLFPLFCVLFHPAFLLAITSCNNFQHLTQAIIELQSQDRPKYAETARRYNIDKSTLWRRFKGKTASNHDANSYSRQKLTSAQEEILIGHVNKLTDRGIPPTPQMLKNIAEDLDHQRKAADNSGISKLLQSSKTAFIIEKYNISPSNVYNFDEKGFQIGLSRSTKRVVPREALRRGKLVGASQDGNREFITLIAAICADYSYLPPALIYKGESKDFQDTWLEDFDHSSEVAFFASTENGWSCDALGLHWLQRIFDCHTKQKAGRAYRLLILDGHNSHINLKFIDYADRNRILIAVLPSHSTHRLQPLDVGLFPHSPPIMLKAFTAKNIEAGWRATGIHPLDPGKVLSKISHSSDERAMKTPGSLRAIRRITRRLRKEGLMDSRVTALSRASEKLATQYELVQHENRDLQEALKLAHKKGKRRKALGLFNPEEMVASRSFSVQPRWNWRGDADEQRKQAIEDRRLQVAISREEKARESAEKKNSGLQCVRPCESSREAKRAEKREAAAKLKAERSAREAERQAIREVKFEVAATSKPGVRGHKDMVARVCATGIQPRNNSEEERVKIGSEASVARDHRKYGGRFLSLSGLIFALACRSGNLLHDVVPWRPIFFAPITRRAMQATAERFFRASDAATTTKP
ncbi:DDE superfamily endonuclease [Hirsutella rhossiliensis]